MGSDSIDFIFSTLNTMNKCFLLQLKIEKLYPRGSFAYIVGKSMESDPIDSANGEPVDWVAHSRGGAIFTQAVNITPDDLSRNSILFHAGANNELVTQGILNDAQIKYGIGTPGNEQPPYKNSDADLVPNIVGFNGNPIQWIKSILAIPDLSKGPLISPHTLPPGYIVAPPRYTTPYTEIAP